MSVTQTVEIPVDHRLTIDVPREVPAGPVVLTFTPACKPDTIRLPSGNDRATPLTDALSGILSSLGDINLDEIRAERLARHLNENSH